MTLTKIIGSHSDEEPIPGSIVWMDLDVRSARDFAGASVVKNLEVVRGGIGDYKVLSRYHYRGERLGPRIG